MICALASSLWRKWKNGKAIAKPRAATRCLFVDSGFNRLGFGEIEIAELMAQPNIFEGWELCLIASHLACADDPTHPMNGAQLERFSPCALAVLPKAPGLIGQFRRHYVGR